MSIYPFKVTKKSGRANSVSGGKDYHLVLISAANGNSLFIKRFGKANTWGSGFKVERYDSVNLAMDAFTKKYREKMGKEYGSTLIDKTVACNTEVELRAAIGESYWNKIGARNLEWLIPGVDTKGVREDRSTEWEEDGGHWRPVETPRIKAPVIVETAQERAVENPTFGLF